MQRSGATLKPASLAMADANAARSRAAAPPAIHRHLFARFRTYMCARSNVHQAEHLHAHGMTAPDDGRVENSSLRGLARDSGRRLFVQGQAVAEVETPQPQFPLITTRSIIRLSASRSTRQTRNRQSASAPFSRGRGGTPLCLEQTQTQTDASTIIHRCVVFRALTAALLHAQSSVAALTMPAGRRCNKAIASEPRRSLASPRRVQPRDVRCCWAPEPLPKRSSRHRRDRPAERSARAESDTNPGLASAGHDCVSGRADRPRHPDL